MKKTLQTGFLSAVIALAAGTSDLKAQDKVGNAGKATIENFQPKQELINDTNVWGDIIEQARMDYESIMKEITKEEGPDMIKIQGIIAFGADEARRAGALPATKDENERKYYQYMYHNLFTYTSGLIERLVNGGRSDAETIYNDVLQYGKGKGERKEPESISDEEIRALYKYKFADIKESMGKFDTIAFDNKAEIQDAISYFRKVRNTLIEMQQVSENGTQKVRKNTKRKDRVIQALLIISLIMSFGASRSNLIQKKSS